MYTKPAYPTNPPCVKLLPREPTFRCTNLAESSRQNRAPRDVVLKGPSIQHLIDGIAKSSMTIL